jgi:serine/threonine protein kinase
MDLMKAMLQKDPLKRISAAQALNHHWFIKMKTKNDKGLQPKMNTRQRSLSTIVENSELMDIT